MQTKYYNEATKLEEWRCRYCTKSYYTSGGTTVLRRHLEEFYEILRESLRDVTVKNI